MRHVLSFVFYSKPIPSHLDPPTSNRNWISSESPLRVTGVQVRYTYPFTSLFDKYNEVTIVFREI